MHEITINDNVNYKKYDFLEDFLIFCLNELKVKNGIFSIIFVDEKEIQEINKNNRGIDKITDVISFAFEEGSQIVYNDIRFLGDIYVCIPQMIRQSNDYDHSEKRELSFLCIHGLLHLLGYNHENETQEKEMFRIQEMLLDGANIKR